MSKTWALAAVALLAACQPAPARQSSDAPKVQSPQAFQDEQSKSPVLGLEFWVNDAKSPMRTRTGNGRDEVETQIGTGEFEVRFPRRESGDPALRMISWTDRTIFALEPGMKFVDVQFLQPGTGSMDKRSGRMALHLHGNGHNYYPGEQMQKHSEGQEKVLFERAHENPDLKVDSLFVTAVIDLNSNETVDLGEYEYFQIRLIR